jgi:hypothetical protein
MLSLGIAIFVEESIIAEGIGALAGEILDMETMSLTRGGEKIADLTRVLDLESNENKVRVDYTDSATPQDRKTVRDIMGRNINMFGQGASGSIRMILLKKGSVEHWAFASREFEKRDYSVVRDAKTERYLNKFIELYFAQRRGETAESTGAKS